MLENSILDLVYIFFFIIVMFLLISQFRNNHVPTDFDVLLKETERHPNPYLKSQHNEILPDPVTRYLQITHSKPINRPSYVEVQFSGYQRLRPESNLLPVKGKNYYTLARPGYISYSRFTWLSLIWIDIKQRYSINDGYMQGRIYSIIPVLSMIGLRLSKLCLARYISDAVWFPWVFEPTTNLDWEPEDDQTAIIRVSYHPLITRFRVRFNRENQIETISSLGQYVGHDGTVIPYERVVSYCDYQQIQGISIPMKMRVVWRCPEEERIVQDLKIISIQYHFAPFAKK